MVSETAVSLQSRMMTNRFLRHYEAFLLSKLKIVRSGLKECANELNPLASASFIAASMVIGLEDPIFMQFSSVTRLAEEVRALEFSKVAKARGDAIVNSVKEFG